MKPEPYFLYGTAWKEDETERLVRLALDAGFRGIDTANQRKHYFEAGVGAAIAGFPREELFLQTKFTFRDGQDHRLPYDPDADVATQVQQSFASSLEHLRVDTIDSYVLHGPTRRRGLGTADWAAWRSMESLHADGKTRVLGISNVALDQLEELTASAKVQPAFVQNRCYASTGWDARVRAFCRANGIRYQGFSLLTANREVLASPAVRAIAARLRATVPQVIFRFAIAMGMTVLTGTTSPEHMRQDLASSELALSDDDLRTIEAAAT
jgi:diketogulonate reductase-like aldo/keto reductase